MTYHVPAAHRQPKTVAPSIIVSATKEWLGAPYVHQASAKGTGCDCLGLVRGVWRDIYKTEPEIPPPYTPDWNERAWGSGHRDEPLLNAAKRNLVAVSDREPGRIIIFRIMRDGPAKHCGILISRKKFIHAYAGRAVIESWLNRWWQTRIVGVFGFPALVPVVTDNQGPAALNEER